MSYQQSFPNITTFISNDYKKKTIEDKFKIFHFLAKVLCKIQPCTDKVNELKLTSPHAHTHSRILYLNENIGGIH